MLEFALVLPLIILVIVMFIEIGRVVYYYTALNNAVREGARYGIVHRFASSGERLAQIQDRVTKFAIWMALQSDDVTVFCDQDTTDEDNPCDEYVTVAAGVEVVPITPFLTRILGTGTTYGLHAESTMQMTPYGSQ